MTDLTEQWKKGELPEGVYYCNTGNTVETLFTWGKNYHQLTNNKDEVYIPEMDDCEIIALVPSYDELQNMNEAVNECMAANIKLVEQNTQLKEQINKCYLDAINRGTANTVKAVKEFGMPERIKELVEENAQLKEQINHLLKTQARQFVDNQKLQVKAEKAKDVVNIDTARHIKQLKELLKECKDLFVLEKGFMVKCIREKTLSNIIAKIDEVLK